MKFKVSKEVYEIEGVKGKPFVVQVPYPPVKDFRKRLEKALGKDLGALEKQRGEDAHITLLTASEYDVIDPVFPVKEAKKMFKPELLHAEFMIDCLGMGRKDGEEENETYFLVVHSKDLYKVREKIKKEFERRGGDRSQFKAKNYRPHITVGYLKEDLHAKDGVVKDKSSCVAEIEVV